jgi:putative membrane protein
LRTGNGVAVAGVVTAPTRKISKNLPMKLLLRWAISAFVIWVAAALIPGINVTGGLWSYLWIALVFGLVNAFIGSIVKVLTIPITLITFGLFMLVINTGMFAITAAWTDALTITSFWSALFGSLLISVVGSLLRQVLRRTVSK